MLRKFGKLGIVSLLIAIPLFSAVWMTLFYSEVGMAKDVGIHEPELAAQDYSSVPQTVIDDAVAIAAEFVGNQQEKLQGFTDQLVATGGPAAASAAA
jgi:hypothetical protein